LPSSIVPSPISPSKSRMLRKLLVPKRRLVVILYSTVPRSVGPIPVGTAVEPRRIIELILGNADPVTA